MPPSWPEEFTVYQCHRDYKEQLMGELQRVFCELGEHLIVCEGPAQQALWAQNVWFEPELMTVESIGDAAKKLRAKGRSWAFYPHSLHRRGELITQKLPPIRQQPLGFPPEALPDSPMGAFLLLDQQTVLFSPQCREPYSHGAYLFAEDKEGPPNRAYLKLWEAFTRLQKWPRPGQHCLELGASPGGWTYVLAGLGAKVTAVDRSPLDPAVAAMPQVSFVAGDAFSFGPECLGKSLEGAKIDWLFSDVICYPDKLYDFVQTWLASGLCDNVVVTVKFQGADHYSWIPRFQQIAGGRLVHLFHNKHELTFARLSAPVGDDRRWFGYT